MAEVDSAEKNDTVTGNQIKTGENHSQIETLDKELKNDSISSGGDGTSPGGLRRQTLIFSRCRCFNRLYPTSKSPSSFCTLRTYCVFIGSTQVVVSIFMLCWFAWISNVSTPKSKRSARSVHFDNNGLIWYAVTWGRSMDGQVIPTKNSTDSDSRVQLFLQMAIFLFILFDGALLIVAARMKNKTLLYVYSGLSLMWIAMSLVFSVWLPLRLPDAVSDLYFHLGLTINQFYVFICVYALYHQLSSGFYDSNTPSVPLAIDASQGKQHSSHKKKNDGDVIAADEPSRSNTDKPHLSET